MILQEIRMVEDTPDDYIHDFFERDVLAGTIPSDFLSSGRRNGSRPFVATICFDSFRPATGGVDLVISAAGNCKHDRLVELVRRSFGSLAGSSLCEADRSPRGKPGTGRSPEGPGTGASHHRLSGAVGPQPGTACGVSSECRSRGEHEFLAVSGDPGKEGPGLCHLFLSDLLQGHRPVRNLRRDGKRQGP